MEWSGMEMEWHSVVFLARSVSLVQTRLSCIKMARTLRQIKCDRFEEPWNSQSADTSQENQSSVCVAI